MKKIKCLIFLMLLIISFNIINYQIEAKEKNYLETKNYITLSPNKDNSQEIEDFLEICQEQNKDAYFNNGTYLLKENIKLVEGVSLLGSDLTIFKGENGDYQVTIFDDLNTPNITIENIIFDNVTIYSQQANSNNWVIKNNIFLNAKKVSLDTDPGLKPDSSNQNGGENTGYYILKSKTNGEISSNLFLRDEDSLGRGIAVYQSYDVVIKDNYFGCLEDLDSSIVSDSVKTLKNKLLKLDNFDFTLNQGYFMTAINVISGDNNTEILSNHFSLNKNLTEINYEDKSGVSLGYNRDHIVYAKEYNNLKVVGNYFKGQNKNQDGGIKIRNGENALIYKNIFEDNLVLLYIQTGSNKNYFKNTYISNNIFLNQDYISTRYELTSPNNSYTVPKYITQSFLIYFKNYIASSEISNLTIENNKILSLGLVNEEMRIEGYNNDLTSNIYLENNTNYLNKDMNIVSDYDYNLGTKYETDLINNYKDIDEYSLLNIEKAQIEIENEKIKTPNTYLNNYKYNNEELKLDTNYEVLTTLTNNENILVEEEIETIPSTKYQILKLNIPSLINIDCHLHQVINLSDYLDLDLFSNYDVLNYDENYFTINKNNDILIEPQMIGNNLVITLDCGGFNITLNISVDDEVLSDFEVMDLNIKLGEETDLVFSGIEGYPYEFTFSYNEDCLSINDLKVMGLKVGSHIVKVKETYSQIVKYFKINVSANDLNIIKNIELGLNFSLNQELLNKSTLNYDTTKLKIEDNLCYVLVVGTYNLELNYDGKIINYIINVRAKENILVSDLTLNLNETSSLDLIYSGDISNLEFIYNPSCIEINNLEVKGLKVGSHGLSVINKVNNEIINIIITVTNA